MSLLAASTAAAEVDALLSPPVDPDTLLADILDAARALDTNNPVAEILVDDILALHDHLSSGGAKPAAWQ